MRLVRRAAASCQGCGAATRRGSHCADCRPAGAARPSAAKRGYGHRWRQRRDAFLAKHRYCADGCGRLATIVDHVIPKGPPFYGADDESSAGQYCVYESRLGLDADVAGCECDTACD